jgi:WD40 repeat protein
MNTQMMSARWRLAVAFGVAMLLGCFRSAEPEVLFALSESGHDTYISPRGDTILTHYGMNPVKFWKREEGRWVRRFVLPHPTAIAFSEDGRRVALALLHQGVGVWDTNTFQRVAWFPGTDVVESLTLDRSGRTIAFVYFHAGHLVVLRDARTVWTASGLQIGSGVLMSPSGTHLVAVDAGRIIVWNVRDGRVAFSSRDTRHPIGVMGFSNDGSTFAVARTEGTPVFPDGFIDLWSVPLRKRMRTLKVSDPPHAGALDPSGKRVFAARDGELMMWRGRREYPDSVRCCHYDIVSVVIPTDDPKYVFTTGDDSRVLKWRF